MSRSSKFRAYADGLGFLRIMYINYVDGKPQKIAFCKKGEKGLKNLDISYVSLEQFTGLKDKNGAEIYEGDIVYLAGQGDVEITFPFFDVYDAAAENDIGEILGNIHENPELLEDEKRVSLAHDPMTK